MNKETKEVYNVLQDVFKNVWELLKYAELKNGVLLTFNIALILIQFRGIIFIYRELELTTVERGALFILMFCSVLLLMKIIHSFFPQDSNFETTKNESATTNIFFFGDIAKIDSNKYLELVLENITEKNEQKSIDKKALKLLSNQIVKLSERTQEKYTSFKTSFRYMYILIGVWSLYALYIYFVKVV